MPRIRSAIWLVVMCSLLLWPVALASADPSSAQAADGPPGDLFGSVNGGVGNGLAAVYQYTPAGLQSTFAAGLSRARGLAFDSLGNLLVATTFCEAICSATILKIAPDGAQSVFGKLPTSYFGEGVAIDLSGSVFVIAINNASTQSMIFQFTPDGLRRPFALLRGQSFDLAFDSAGSLFAAGSTSIYKYAPDGTRSIFVGPEAFAPFEGPQGLAFDAFGNLFVSTRGFPFNNDRIYKFTPSAVQSTFATGLAFPRGVAFDSAGNLFVAESPLSTAGDILKYTPDGAHSVFASGIGDPEGRGGPEFLTVQP